MRKKWSGPKNPSSDEAQDHFEDGELSLPMDESRSTANPNSAEVASSSGLLFQSELASDAS